MGRAYFMMSMIMINAVCLVRKMIANGSKGQVKKMKALTLTWQSYPLLIVVVLHIVAVLYFSWFSPIFYCFFQAMRKDFFKASMIQRTNQNNSKRSNQPREIWNIPFLRITGTRNQKRQVSCEHGKPHFVKLINYH